MLVDNIPDWCAGLELDWRNIDERERVTKEQRHEPRAVVAVEIESMNGRTTFGLNLPNGRSTIVLTHSQLKKLQAEARTAQQQQDLDRARTLFAEKLERHVKANPSVNSADNFYESVPGLLHDMYPKGGISSLVRVAVLDPDVPPPDSPLTRQEASDALLRQAITAQAQAVTSIAQSLEKPSKK